nr:PIN domain-containing protein [uncultured Vibrio sp.]
MELQTRLVFIDTSAFEKKNYQFGQHSLGRLQELIEDEKIHLLITDVTRKDTYFELTDDHSQVISFNELDINGK